MRVATLLGLLTLVPATLLACDRLDRELGVTPAPLPSELAGARWPTLPLEYCVVRQAGNGFVEHERLTELVQQAFDAWGVDVRSGGDCPGPVGEGNERNEVSWGRLGGGDVRLNEAGSTVVRYRQSQGGSVNIVEADIMIDSDPPHDQRNEDCLLTTLLHETGHFLGIQHQSSPAIMSPVITDCSQGLSRIDRTALSELYPAASPRSSNQSP